MNLLQGKPIADAMCASLKERVCAFSLRYNQPPTLALLRVGEDPASGVYLRNKVQRAEEIGVHAHVLAFPAQTSAEALTKCIEKLNKDATTHGIIVQLPLPNSLCTEDVINAIAPDKDVDGLTTVTQGNLFRGAFCLKPCTAQGILVLLKTAHADLTGKHAVILGRSLIVGRPTGLMLLHENCTVTLMHSRSRDIAAICHQADIVIAAIGKPHFVTRAFIKPGATVIDVGISREIRSDGTKKLVGDVDFEDVAPIAGFITPVPGGVGPMTVCCLMQNTIEAAVNQMKKH
ncbi:MAG: bifunctional 5,10-methylenetetrahydrofolate dehydrogenase/5,10-methenyltetrahydrofolate cyclohydrolase [Holosporales bacterium]|nr:bifunctional 5,10-methylenetetrahydrofolate dehydrogenase/5,10-methenyltetrahydrofolate cyclohydrolase [Holosporales bacterium]